MDSNRTQVRRGKGLRFFRSLGGVHCTPESGVQRVVHILNGLALAVHLADQSLRRVPSTPLRVNSSKGFEEIRREGNLRDPAEGVAPEGGRVSVRVCGITLNGK
jgi:hypothetical protein